MKDFFKFLLVIRFKKESQGLSFLALLDETFFGTGCSNSQEKRTKVGYGERKVDIITIGSEMVLTIHIIHISSSFSKEWFGSR